MSLVSSSVTFTGSATLAEQCLPFDSSVPLSKIIQTVKKLYRVDQEEEVVSAFSFVCAG